jgi:hypothetical protein
MQRQKYNLFLKPDNGFSLMPKHVANNKNDTNSVVVDGLYFPFTGKHCQGACMMKLKKAAKNLRIVDNPISSQISHLATTSKPLPPR